MPYETNTASGHLDLLTRLKTFVTGSGMGSQAWTLMRWSGIADYLCSSYVSGNKAYYAFNGLSGGWVTALNAATPSYLGCQFVSAVDIRRFYITMDGPTWAAPKDFSLQYSSDGSAWTTLQSWSDVLFSQSGGSRLKFDVTAASPGAKSYWRIYITAIHGATNVAEIDGLEFMELIGPNELNHAVWAHALLRGPGLAGTDQIFVGAQIYDNPDSDFYNLRIAGFTGYVAFNAFQNQPGSTEPGWGMIGIPLWAGDISYWLIANGRRIALAAQVGGVADASYESLYMGFYLPYASPGQYPYPMMVSGMFPADWSTRYSDTSNPNNSPSASSIATNGHSVGYKGNRQHMRIRSVGGSWGSPSVWPYMNGMSLRDTGGSYPAIPLVISDGSPNVYGEIDGVCCVPGFGTIAAQDTLTMGSDSAIIIRDAFRTGNQDYYALRLV